MTITYTLNVSNSRLCGFSKLLFNWKGSVYKLVYKEMMIFLLLYYTLSMIYRYALAEFQKRTFEKIVAYFQTFLDLIPLTFLLGFYVAIVVGRWWNQYLSIPWPDRLMGYINTLIHGSDERGRLVRRTLMRWLNLSHVMVMQSISIVVKKRFPTSQHLVEAGLMTSHEKRKLKDLPTQHNKFWVPTIWFSTLLSQCMEEGMIRDEIHLKTLLDEVTSFKGSLGMLYSYDWISIPLVYTQVTTIAVYGFFFACLMGRQYVERKPDGQPSTEVDLYLPLFTLVQFFFYMGWLKVAEVLINPFGEDEDDFETNWIIDRNFQVAMLGVDEMYGDLPVLEKDAYWDELEPELPYTRSTICHKNEPFMGSTADFSLNPEDMSSQMVTQMETIPENGSHPSKLAESQPIATANGVSSPTRLRHFLSNITSAFSNETISGSKHQDLENSRYSVNEAAHSRYNVNESVRDSPVVQSPVLQRIKSHSIKRSSSHVERLSSPRRGSMSHIDVTCGTMGQPIVSHVTSLTPTGVSRVHSHRQTTPVNFLIRGEAQRSHSSCASLAFSTKDSEIPHRPLTYVSRGPCDPSGDFYKKPEPPEPGFSQANVSRTPLANPEILVNTDIAQPTHTITNPFLVADPSSAVIPDRAQRPPSYIDFISSGNTDRFSSGSNLKPVIDSDRPQAPAHCNTILFANGANPCPISSLPSSLIPSQANSQTTSSVTTLPCDTVNAKKESETAVPHVHFSLDKEGKQLPDKLNSTLRDGKADSQDSIDSTYDSSYDTVNSQEPLLPDSDRWKEEI